MKLIKCDEFESLLNGLQYIDSINPTECYYFDKNENDEYCVKKKFDFSDPYPFLLVNIGSGVSILSVLGANNFSRVSGTRLFFISVLLVVFFYSLISLEKSNQKHS